MLKPFIISGLAVGSLYALNTFGAVMGAAARSEVLQARRAFADRDVVQELCTVDLHPRRPRGRARGGSRLPGLPAGAA